MVPTSARAIARPASMQGGFSRGRNRGTCRWFRRANLSLSSTSRPLRRLASRSRPISPPKRMRLSNNPPRNVCFWHKADMGGDFSSTGLSRYDARLSLRERHMRRREFITLVGAAAAWPLSVRAQQPAHKLARIGLLQPSLDNPIVARGYPAFLEEMKKSGFSEGQNLTIRFVRLDQDSQGLFAETAELLQKVDLVVSVGAEAALQAVLAASRTIPVVIWAINYDPVALGYVNSLVRPGGNITGIVSLQTELAAKQVELLTQALPVRTRLALLWDAISADQFTAAERQAKSQRLEVQSLKLENPPYDFDAAFRSFAKESPQMLLVLSSQYFTRRSNRAGSGLRPWRTPARNCPRRLARRYASEATASTNFHCQERYTS